MTQFVELFSITVKQILLVVFISYLFFKVLFALYVVVLVVYSLFNVFGLQFNLCLIGICVNVFTIDNSCMIIFVTCLQTVGCFAPLVNFFFLFSDEILDVL